MGGKRLGLKGVILDEHVIFNFDEKTGITHLVNGLDYIFNKLRFSNILSGISFRSHFPIHHTNLLKQLEIPQSSAYFLFDSSSLHKSLQNISDSWSSDGVVLFVTSDASEDVFQEILSRGWAVAVVTSKPAESCKNHRRNHHRTMFYHLRTLEELPLTICKLNREILGEDSITVVGYMMKQARDEEFSKRGAFPMCANESGLIFMPLKSSISMDLQLNEVDAVLHKATDEILSIDQNCSSSESCLGVVYTPGMLEFLSEMANRPDCCVIDRLEKVVPLLDRGMIRNMLHGVDVCSSNSSIIRPPRFLEVTSFDDLSSGRGLAEVGLLFPLIVKPRIACGLADAHSMAVVFGADDFAGLGVPLPAIVQEYVQHSGRMFKIYVLGGKVYNFPKNSTPNSTVLSKMYEENGNRPLLFDSLRCCLLSESGGGECGILDFELVTKVADFLAEKLDLTIFGFDVVVEDGSGDHVIVDINYFPSFKEVPDDVGIPAFWDSIKQRFREHLRIGGDLWRRKGHHSVL